MSGVSVRSERSELVSCQFSVAIKHENKLLINDNHKN